VSGDVDWQTLYERVRHTIATSADVPVHRVEAIIYQAVGMTMEYLGCSGLLALETLNERSEQTGQPLFGVALDVVHRRFQPG
jgi:hypothetical protein